MNSFPFIPSHAVLDPEVTFTLPKHLTATTGMDALTHAIEGYITNYIKGDLNDRKNNELRNISITKDYTNHALGSVLIQFGDTKVIVTASVELKKPKWMSEDDVANMDKTEKWDVKYDAQ